MANNFKGEIMAYFYNNKKLEQVILTQQKKVKMYEGIKELKKDVQRWKRAQANVIEFFSNMMGGSNGLINKDDPEMGEIIKNARSSLVEPLNEETLRHLTSKEEKEDRLLNAKQKILEELKDKFSMQKLRLLNQEDPNYERKKISYKKIKESLPLLAKWYLSINKKYVNQALFIENVNDAKKIKDEASKGICRTNCDLKSIMKKEINLVIEKEITKEYENEENDRKMHIITKKKKEEDIITLNDLPETKEFVKFSRIWITLVGVYPKALISNASTFAYLFMILSMCWNAGLISILYPLAVFGYALIEEARPSKYYWDFITFYTVLIILIKTVFQLDIWFYINTSLYQFNNPDTFNADQPFDMNKFPFTFIDINVSLF